MKIEIANISELPEVARNLLSSFGEERFFAFFGKMGVGKTTLIKEMCNVLGVRDVVCSPTFAIVNEYRISAESGVPGLPGTPDSRTPNPELSRVYHFDFYRLKSVAEAYDIGYEEYFYSGCYCFTEWTEKVEELLPERYVRVELEEKEGKRVLNALLITE